MRCFYMLIHRRHVTIEFSLSEVDEDEDEDDTGDAESDFEEVRQEMNLATHDEGPSARDIEGQRRLGML